MLKRPQCPIVAIEEHYWDDELASHFSGPEGSKAGIIESRLRSFGGDRIADMDAAGVGVCVLSHGAPSGQKMPHQTRPRVTVAIMTPGHQMPQKQNWAKSRRLSQM